MCLVHRCIDLIRPKSVGKNTVDNFSIFGLKVLSLSFNFNSEGTKPEPVSFWPKRDPTGSGSASPL